jgi:hypothetical protein
LEGLGHFADGFFGDYAGAALVAFEADFHGDVEEEGLQDAVVAAG